MTKSEAGKIGNLISMATLHDNYMQRIERYNQNPRLCKECGSKLPYGKRFDCFCSQSCAARHNNKNRKLTIKQRYEKSIKQGGDGHRYKCIQCGGLRIELKNPFCSESCKEQYQEERERILREKYQEKMERIKKAVFKKNNKVSKWDIIKQEILSSGRFPFTASTNDTRRRVVRRFLIETQGHKCSVCGLTEWNGQPIPLVVDHIDGDSTNHSINNLRIICCNCDAQTSSYKRRGNHKSTRTWRSKYSYPK